MNRLVLALVLVLVLTLSLPSTAARACGMTEDDPAFYAALNAWEVAVTDKTGHPPSTWELLNQRAEAVTRLGPFAHVELRLQRGGAVERESVWRVLQGRSWRVLWASRQVA